MNEVEKALANARELLGLYYNGGVRYSALQRLVSAIDKSGIIQDAARWQWFTDDLERNHGVSRARINATTDATMKRGA